MAIKESAVVEKTMYFLELDLDEFFCILGCLRATQLLIIHDPNGIPCQEFYSIADNEKAQIILNNLRDDLTK